MNAKIINILEVYIQFEFLFSKEMIILFGRKNKNRLNRFTIESFTALSHSCFSRYYIVCNCHLKAWTISPLAFDKFAPVSGKVNKFIVNRAQRIFTTAAVAAAAGAAVAAAAAVAGGNSWSLDVAVNLFVLLSNWHACFGPTGLGQSEAEAEITTIVWSAKINKCV